MYGTLVISINVCFISVCFILFKLNCCGQTFPVTQQRLCFVHVKSNFSNSVFHISVLLGNQIPWKEHAHDKDIPPSCLKQYKYHIYSLIHFSEMSLIFAPLPLELFLYKILLFPHPQSPSKENHPAVVSSPLVDSIFVVSLNVLEVTKQC